MGIFDSVYSRFAPTARALNTVPPQSSTSFMKSSPYSTRSGIQASAETINLSRPSHLREMEERMNASREWQKNAYQYYRLIGDVHYLISLVSDQVSKMNLFVGVVTDTSKVPSPISEVPNETLNASLKADAWTILRMIENAQGGTSTFLRRISSSLQIAGECFIIEEPTPVQDPAKSRLYVRSINEVSVSAQGKNTVLQIIPTPKASKESYTTVQEDAVAYRIWRPDPEYYSLPDSPLYSVLDDCDSLLNVKKTQRVVSRSQQSSGLLVIPSTFQTRAEQDFEDYLNSQDFDDTNDPDGPTLSQPMALEQELLEALTSPISDENSAATIMPFVLRGPAEDSDKVRYIPVSRTDDGTSEKINELLRSILGGLDITPEIANAILSSGYSNDITKQLYRSTIESLTISICHSLTSSFLHRELIKMGHSVDEVANLVFWYDASAITVDSDLSESSNFGFQNRIISHGAWRRANGYSEADAPTPTEEATLLVRDKGIISQDATDRVLSINFPGIFNGIQGQPSTPDATAFNKSQSKAPDFLVEPSKPSPKPTEPVEEAQVEEAQVEESPVDEQES